MYGVVVPHTPRKNDDRFGPRQVVDLRQDLRVLAVPTIVG